MARHDPLSTPSVMRANLAFLPPDASSVSSRPFRTPANHQLSFPDRAREYLSARRARDGSCIVLAVGRSTDQARLTAMESAPTKPRSRRQSIHPIQAVDPGSSRRAPKVESPWYYSSTPPGAVTGPKFHQLGLNRNRRALATGPWRLPGGRRNRFAPQVRESGQGPNARLGTRGRSREFRPK